jgi:hypothetical protein
MIFILQFLLNMFLDIHQFGILKALENNIVLIQPIIYIYITQWLLLCPSNTPTTIPFMLSNFYMNNLSYIFGFAL